MILEIDKIKALIPYVGSAVVFCGFINLNLYYYNFNINITDYIEITEILNLFFWTIIITVLLIGYEKLIEFFTLTKEDSEKRYDSFLEIIENNSFYKRLWKFIINSFTFSLIVFIIFCFVLFTFYTNNPKFELIQIIFFYCFSLYISAFFLIEFQRTYRIKFKKNIDNTYNTLLYLFILFFFTTIHYTFLKIYYVENLSNDRICFTYLNEEIQSNNNLIYVGQTKDYIFMYNKISKESSVYSRSEIKKTVFEDTEN